MATDMNGGADQLFYIWFFEGHILELFSESDITQLSGAPASTS